MSTSRLFSTVFGVAVLTMMASPTNAQMNDQTARKQAGEAVRAKLNLKPDQFLQVHRDEELEQALALTVGKPGVFIYRFNQAGDEFNEQSIVHHIFTDSDPTYIVAVRAVDGSIYRVHGFTDSRAEFVKLMTAAGPKIVSPEQAESVADFYREVNPEHRSMNRISSLLDLKQAAERQCQAVPFDPNEKDFEAWWKHAKPLYSGTSFKQTSTRSGNGYAVEWIVLSSPGAGLCGGAALRARLEVGSDGRIGEPTFVPLQGADLSHEATGHAQGTSVP